jgi:dihydropyrimidinase
VTTGRRRPSKSLPAASNEATEKGDPHVRSDQGGRVITAADDYVGDVYVEDERISLIGESLDVDADRVIDARGKYVLPGCIDPHTHLDMPFGGTVTIDDVESGRRAAAFGGTTCHVDFVIQPQGSTFAAAARRLEVEGRRQAGDRHGLPHGDHRPDEGGSLEELASLPEQGVTVVQALHGLQGRADGQRRDALPRDGGRRESGALVMVHAENGDAIDVLVKEALAAGNTEPLYHALTRPPEAEG